MKRLLLIDYDPAIRELLSRHFDRRYEILCAETGARGLALLQHQSVDLAVVEYRLPDCSGLDLLARIKAKVPRLPVIMTTACGSEWVCASAYKLGARDYLIKPFHPDDLAASVRFILSAVSPQREARQNALTPRHPIRRTALQPDEFVVQQAARYIQEHYAENLSLTMLAHQVGMSKFVLCRKFKAVMNASFRGYLLQLRITKARELLQTRRYSVTEVAHMVGFSDLPHFDKVFKRRAGMSPSAYRALSLLGAPKIEFPSPGTS